MPTYEYECKECSYRFETVQRITDDSLSECVKCGGSVRKILFPVGILFKGPGFHITDYRKPEAKSDSDVKPVESSKPEKPIVANET